VVRYEHMTEYFKAIILLALDKVFGYNQDGIKFIISNGFGLKRYLFFINNFFQHRWVPFYSCL